MASPMARAASISVRCCTALASLLLVAPAFAGPALQLSTPEEVEVAWSELIDAETWGYEYALASAASDPRVFVSGGRIASPYFVAAFDAVDGAELWRHEAPYPIGADLATTPDGERVYALAFDLTEQPFRRAQVLALDGVTGVLLWQSTFTTWSAQVVSQPPRALTVSPDGAHVVVVGEEDEFGAQVQGFATIGSFRASDGQLEWIQRQGPAGEALWSFEDVEVAPDGSTTYAIGGDGLGQNGTLVASAFDTVFGFPIWQRQTSGGIALDLVVAPDGQQLAVAAESGSAGPDLFALAAGDGGQLWSRNFGDRTIDLEYDPSASRLVVHSLEDGLLPGSQKRQLTTRCLDAANGTTVWKRDFATPWGEPAGIEEFPGERDHTLAVDPTGERVFTAASRGPQGGPEDVAASCYRLSDGALLWEIFYDVALGYENQRLREMTLSPTGDRLLLVGDDAQPGDPQGLSVRTIDPTSGATLWSVTWNEASSAVNVPIALARSADAGSLFLLDRLNLGAYLMVALDAQDGAERWRTDVEFPGWSSVEAAGSVLLSQDDSVVYVHLPGSTSSLVEAFWADSGILIWSGEVGALANPTFGFPAAELSQDDGSLFVGSDASAALGGLVVEALEPTSGSLLWRQELPSDVAQEQFAGLVAEPAGERLFLAGTRDVKVGAPAGADSDLVWYALDAQDGQLVFEGSFTAQPPETPSFEQAMDLALSPSGTSATVAGRVLGPVDSLCLATFSTGDGSLLWSEVASGPQGTSRVPRDLCHAALGGVLAVASVTGPGGADANARVDAYLADFGLPLWSRTFDFGAGEELVSLRTGPDDVTLYGIGTRGLGTVAPDELFAFALDALDGELLWVVSYDSPTVGSKLGGFDDAGHDLCLDAEGNGLYLAGTVWNGDQLADSIVLRLLLPSLYADPFALSLVSGGVQSFELRAGPETANDLYLVLGSLGGTSPSLSIDGLDVPLVVDAYTLLTATKPNKGVLQSTLGVLDGLGRAEAAIAIPAGTNPALAGLQLHHAFLSLDWFGSWTFVHASNAVPLYLVP